MTEKDLHKPDGDNSLCTFNIKTGLNYVLKIQLEPRSKHALRSIKKTHECLCGHNVEFVNTPCDTQRDTWA